MGQQPFSYCFYCLRISYMHIKHFDQFHPISFPYFLLPRSLFFFPLKPTGSTCLVQRCRAIHGSMSNLLGTTFLKKTDSSLPPAAINCQQFLDQEWDFMNSFSIHAEILTGLILYRPCAYSHNYCEFMCVTVLVSQHFIIKLLKYLTRITFQSNLQTSTKTKRVEKILYSMYLHC